MESTDDPSYPPLFQTPDPNPNHSPNSIPSLPITTLDIPLINLHHLNPNSLIQACRNFGIFRLTNHGIPCSLSSQLYNQSKILLSLPFETKENTFSHPVSYFWGTPALKLNLRNLSWVEGLHVPLGQLHSSCSSSFRCLVSQYGVHMGRIARTVFDALAVELKLDSSQGGLYLSESDATLRVYRYPCCPRASECFGIEAHTDSSVLSIVNQDEVGGLQVFHNDSWFNIAPIPGTLIVNIGDMMQAISNDEYKSMEHRVVANGSKERISLCYFAFPMDDAVIMSSKYKAFTYKEFKARVAEDIKDSGFKVGLERFKMKIAG